ncbi:MAG TPA: zinc-binding dehydrogenase [Phycisphaerales bacterium]|nr:zinc-binding dehydrogenase [Phycisphaerales bacterium]
MKALVISKQGSPVSPSIEAVADWPDVRTPGAGEVVIRTECSALNHMDIWVGMGIPGIDMTYPRVSGCDACGVVEAVGTGVDAAWVGKRVIVNAKYEKGFPTRPGDPPGSTLIPDYELIGEHINGMHCERFIAPATNLALVGEKADPAAAAAFGLVSLTAYSMMVTKGGLRPGQSVLITGIGGGVATAALAIAKWMACPVVVTSRHQSKLDRAKALGADFGVLDQGEDWSKEVRAWTNKRGVDMAVDSIGKPTHLACIKSLARGGAYVTPGNTGGPQATTDLARVFWNQLRVLGSTMGTNDEMRELAALFRAGHLKPVVDSVVPWKEGRRAWEKLEAGEQFGKIVVDWR